MSAADDWSGSPYPAITELAGLPISRLLESFESLGNNCEFGMVQRFNGYDPPGLFRNAGFDSVEAIIRGIETSFDAMFDEGRYEFTLPPLWEDWRLDCQVYGLTFHTGIPASVERNSEAWTRKAGNSIRSYRFMKAKILDELRRGEKIFVFRFDFDVAPDLIGRLHAAIRRHGPGWLLHVVEDASKPFGWTEKRADGLIIAAMAKLMYGLPQVIDLDAWRAIARAALTIVATSQMTSGSPSSHGTA
jgi:hypothetical protein